MTTPDHVVAQLDRVIDPCSEGVGRPMSIVALGLVDAAAVKITGDAVCVSLTLTDPMCVFFREISAAIIDVLRAAGFRDVQVLPSTQLWTPMRMVVGPR